MRLSPAQILENASKLVPRVAARADEIARLRRLPADLVAELKAAQFEGDEPVLAPSGLPEMRVMMAPASSFQVLDTWYTTGLAGSGSNDYTTQDLFVPAEHSFSLLEAPDGA